MYENLLTFIWVPALLAAALLVSWLIKRQHRKQAMQVLQHALDESQSVRQRDAAEQMPLDLFNQGTPRTIFVMEPERFVTLYIDMPDGNHPALQDVKLYAVERNLDFYQQVYHRSSDKPGEGSQYIFANGQPPGTISETDDDSPIVSLAAFMPLPHSSEEPLKIFDCMLDDAFAFAHHFDARLVDEKGVDITSADSQIVRNYRELIAVYADWGEPDTDATGEEPEAQSAESK